MIHTDRRFEEELGELKDSILSMGGLVETMITQTVHAYGSRDSNLANEVINKDVYVDKMEMAIDEQCIRLLALRQPAASDLRFIIMGLKITKDLERMGDLSTNIAQRAIHLNRETPTTLHIDIAQLASLAQNMVRQSLDSFVQHDLDQANTVCISDDTVDKLYWNMHARLIAHMQQHPVEIPQCVDLLQIIRPLERIADYATNIAEEVIFMVSGRDIRHGAGKR